MPSVMRALGKRGWTGSTPRPKALALLLAGFVGLVGCWGQPVDLSQHLEATEVTTGWYDAGIVEGGKNKLVPTISLRLRNTGPDPIGTVQMNAVFRRIGEEEEWGSAFARVIGSDGLAPGASTDPMVLQSQLGYTGEQPRAQLLLHSEFRDARVELFAKQGAAQWTKVGEFEIKRQLLTK